MSENNSDNIYKRKDLENNNILQKFHIDVDSWQGVQKKELQLKLKETSHFLKELGASSVSHPLIPWTQVFLENVDSLEKKAVLKFNSTCVLKNLNEIEKLNNTIEKNIKFNESAIGSLKITNLSNELENFSLDSTQDIFVSDMDIPELLSEKIIGLLEKIKEQNNEINKLTALKKKYSPE